tara:strand:- start:9816 stop:10085 length:270 start_codon:yes stop_codon:yes gene_type:complete
MQGNTYTCPILVSLIIDPICALLSPAYSICTPEQLADQSAFVYALEYATWILLLVIAIKLMDHFHKRDTGRTGAEDGEGIELIQLGREE